MIDLLIQGGKVVIPAGVGIWDVAVRGEKIVAVAEPGTVASEGARVIDASGKIVVPGGVEPHAHIGGPRQVERFGAEPVSRAAIFGGTTTVMDFASQPADGDLHTAIGEAQERWQGNAYTDYTFHPIFAKMVEPGVIAQIPEIVEAGFPSFKIFTTSIRPPGPGSQDAYNDFGRLNEVMELTSEHGAMLMVHAEDDEMVNYNYSQAKERGLWDFWNMHLIHTNLSEDISFRRAISLAQVRNAAVYMVHVSAREGVDAIGEARDLGLPVYGETLHNYACFNAEWYKKPDGAKYHTYPSLKYEDDCWELWAGLLDGRLSAIATDLVATTLKFKMKGKTVADTVGGHNGIETRMGIAYSEGVVGRGMSLERFVDITSANPARIFGCYPQKGAIAAGSDADIAIIDPTVHKKLTLDDLHLDDYSVWEGWEIQGWPVTTVLRGKVMVEDGKLAGGPADGKLLTRSISPEILAAPVC